MEASNTNQNQGVPIITPQPPNRPRRRAARWLTVAAFLIVLGSGAASVLLLVRGGDEIALTLPAATVEINGNGFEPQTVKVKKGDSITWVNKDTQPHHVASDPYPTGAGLLALNSQEPLIESESYTTTFEESGTFTYHDYLNPLGAKATVIVE